LAALGQRDMDSGPERISDPAELSQVRRQALKVHVLAAAAAVLLTMAALLV
jgi:hypothetical protein